MEKILIIDDSQLQANYLKGILEGEYEVMVANTPSEGLSLAMTGKYSLILLDVVMPEMDGFALLQELQGSDETKHIPVIMITSHRSDEESEEKGLMLGAVDYITKPSRPIIVKARVDTHVRLCRYRRQVEEQAMIDEMTGIANRRKYDSYSSMRWREAIRLRLPFTICMLDIDKFKYFNDTYGHPAGDKAITDVAGAIASRLQRTTDFVARYGGEEFVVIILGSEARAAFEYMQKIRQTVEGLHIPHIASDSGWVTVSAGGVTVVPQIGDSYKDYLELADNMLYDAKTLGRNRVVWMNEEKEQWRER